MDLRPPPFYTKRWLHSPERLLSASAAGSRSRNARRPPPQQQQQPSLSSSSPPPMPLLCSAMSLCACLPLNSAQTMADCVLSERPFCRLNASGRNRTSPLLLLLPPPLTCTGLTNEQTNRPIYIKLNL